MTKFTGIYYDDKAKTYYVKTQAITLDDVKKYITKRGFKTKSEALVYKVKEVERVKASYSYIENSNDLRLYEAFDLYLDNFSIGHEKTTSRGIELVINKYYKTLLPDMKLKTINNTPFARFRKQIAENDTMKSDRKNVIIKKLAHIMQDLSDRNLIDFKMYNLIKQELKPVASDGYKFEANFWELDDFNKFLATFSKDDKYYYLFLTLFSIGARIGELRALKWSDLNSENNTLRINKQITSKLGVGHWEIIPHTKTKQARNVIVSTDLVQNLLNFKSECEANDDCFIFFGNEPISENAILNVKKKHCEIANVPYIRNHDFRHSYCVYLFDNGVDAKTVSKQLGHSNTSTTLNVYNHVSSHREEKLISAINNLKI